MQIRQCKTIMCNGRIVYGQYLFSFEKKILIVVKLLKWEKLVAMFNRVKIIFT